jgi:hypothetical protein
VARVDRHLKAGPIRGETARQWLREAEKKAGITHLDGRGLYGMRRAAVDFAKAAKISREGLQAHGGWASTEIPDRIYADQEMGYAREEARDVRAKFRGEPGAVPPPFAAEHEPGNTERTTDADPQRGAESNA